MNRKRSLTMTRFNPSFERTAYTTALALLFLFALGLCGLLNAAAPAAAKAFPTPEAAANALVNAAATFDVPALEQILGPGGKDIIHTGEPAHDRETALKFADHARTQMAVSIDPKSKKRAFLTVGDD